eukprot:TRINITY_DN2713_c1_g1_i1.p1 TRINITY_DN2713_c1_g1~~TRINITY_DN2713_c1_g1_i1.p1  ORF type:complete len:697 (+),score=136.23 TRINITY_DN2713_c1_g1_i1:116-2092(+)
MSTMPRPVRMHPALVATFGEQLASVFTARVVYRITSRGRRQTKVLLVAEDEAGDLLFLCDTDGTVRRLVPVANLAQAITGSGGQVLLRAADPNEPDVLFQEADADYRNQGMPHVVDTIAALRAARGVAFPVLRAQGGLQSAARFSKGRDYQSPRRKMRALVGPQNAETGWDYDSPTPTDSGVSELCDRVPRRSSALSRPSTVPLHPQLRRHFGGGVGAYTARVIHQFTAKSRRQLRVALVTTSVSSAPEGSDMFFVCDADGAVRRAVELTAVRCAATDGAGRVLLQMERASGEPSLLYRELADPRNEGMPPLLDTIAAVRAAAARPLPIDCAGAVPLESMAEWGAGAARASPRRRLQADESGRAEGRDGAVLVSPTPTNSSVSEPSGRAPRAGSPVFACEAPAAHRPRSASPARREETPWSETSLTAEDAAETDPDTAAAPCKLNSRPVGHAQIASAACSETPGIDGDSWAPQPRSGSESSDGPRQAAYRRAREIQLAWADQRRAQCLAEPHRRRTQRGEDRDTEVESTLRSASEQVASLIMRVSELSHSGGEPLAPVARRPGSGEALRRHMLRQRQTEVAAAALRSCSADWRPPAAAAAEPPPVRSASCFAAPPLQRASPAELEAMLAKLLSMRLAGTRGLDTAISYIRRIQLQHRA